MKKRCPNFGKNGCRHKDYDRRVELKLCAGMTGTCYVRERPWTIFTNSHGGYASAIDFNGQCVLHIHPGTVINEKNIKAFVEMLNKRGCTIKTENK